ncbi:hypothetical protein ACIQV3_22590 [Streptomyces sp. NPDC099050]|uniref:hypothetical protein n=1 Tax=Streptomyces sp. NPDC099050 TaxID=3366100 RepID=UPI00380246E3
MPETATTPADTDPIMQFLTIGGAVVELRAHRFMTRYSWKGRPYVGDTQYETDGFRWSCLGCDKQGGPNIFEHDYLSTERDEARNDANDHAETCRAMPRPTA